MLKDDGSDGYVTYDDATSTYYRVWYADWVRGFGGTFLWSLDADYDGHSQDLMDAMYSASLNDENNRRVTFQIFFSEDKIKIPTSRAKNAREMGHPWIFPRKTIMSDLREGICALPFGGFDSVHWACYKHSFCAGCRD